MGWGRYLARTWQIAVQSLYLLTILIVVPLAFDVGGEKCGLSFSLMLASLYATLATIRAIFRETRILFVASALYYVQVLIIPAALLIHLDVCSRHTYTQWPFRMWETLIVNATGPFALLEGICTLTVIQACGRATRALERRSETPTLILLVVTSLLLTVDMSLLLRIYTLPAVLDMLSTFLMILALTLCLFLSVWGIVSKRGSVIESGLLVTYIVYTLYLAFTDFRSSELTNSIFPLTGVQQSTLAPMPTSTGFLKQLGERFIWGAPMSSTEQGILGTSATHRILESQEVLPQHLIDSYSSFISAVANLTPKGIRTMLDFFYAGLYAITPSILCSLVFRMGVFTLSLRLVPYFRHPRYRRLTWKYNPLMFVLYSYGPCLTIAVYTHLLMQHFGGYAYPQTTREESIWQISSVSNLWANSRLAWRFWGWINIFHTLIIYGLELLYTPCNYEAY